MRKIILSSSSLVNQSLIPTLPIEIFLPVMDSDNLDFEINIEAEDFKQLIDNSKFCMGLDESRQYLNGIFSHQWRPNLNCSNRRT